MKRWPARVVAALVSAAASAATAASGDLLDATTVEPRAYGYQIGDLVSRSVRVHVPDALVLDEASVPRPGARGRALELRHVARRVAAEPGGQRIELTFDYQVFLAPPQVRTLELPGFTLRFDGAPREQELRIEAWPVTVAPLVPVDVSPRRGLGELQRDVPPPPIDTAAARTRLVAYAGTALLLLGYLAHVYIGLPWWSRTRRPFAVAWRALRRIPSTRSDARWPEALQRVHDALNRSAGEVVFAHDVERFVTAVPCFRPLRADLLRFFALSQHTFFGAGGAPSAADRNWLLGFCRRCRDAERGSA